MIKSLRNFFGSETTRLVLLGFAIGTVGLVAAQPGSAHNSQAPAGIAASAR